MKLLSWAQGFEEVVWMDNNDHDKKYSSFEAILAVDGFTSIRTDTENAFGDLREYQAKTGDWIFGYLSYDLKNDVEHLFSDNYDGLHFPELFFFQPKKIIRITGDTVDFMYLNSIVNEVARDFDDILKKPLPNEEFEKEATDIRIKMRIFKDEYFRQVKNMLAHIHRGDIYEANFCQEFYAEDTHIDTLKTYRKLNRRSQLS